MSLGVVVLAVLWVIAAQWRDKQYNDKREGAETAASLILTEANNEQGGIQSKQKMTNKH